MLFDLLLTLPQHHCLYSKCLHDDHPQTKLCLNSEVGHDHFKMTSALNHKSNYTDSHHYTPEPCHCSEVTHETSYSVWVWVCCSSLALAELLMVGGASFIQDEPCSFVLHDAQTCLHTLLSYLHTLLSRCSCFFPCWCFLCHINSTELLACFFI